MGTIVEDVAEAAEWVAAALSGSGYIADFSLASLKEIDRFFDEHSRDGKAIPGGLLSESLGFRIFAIGSYIGEVIRHHSGGEWIGNDNEPRAEITVALHLPDGRQCWPTQRSMKRFLNGPEDGIAIYGFALSAQAGSDAEPPKKSWWKFGR